MSEERTRKVFSDTEFVKELMEREVAQQVQDLLAKSVIHMSLDKIDILKDKGEKFMNGDVEESAELDDDDLEEVASVFLFIIIGIICTAVIGASIATSVDFVCGHRW